MERRHSISNLYLHAWGIFVFGLNRHRLNFDLWAVLLCTVACIMTDFCTLSLKEALFPLFVVFLFAHTFVHNHLGVGIEGVLLLELLIKVDFDGVLATAFKSCWEFDRTIGVAAINMRNLAKAVLSTRPIIFCHIRRVLIFLLVIFFFLVRAARFWFHLFEIQLLGIVWKLDNYRRALKNPAIHLILTFC